jgi:threonine synthase
MSRQSDRGAAGMNGCGVQNDGCVQGLKGFTESNNRRLLSDVERIARIARIAKIAKAVRVLNPTSLQKLLAFLFYSCYKMISSPQLAD